MPKLVFPRVRWPSLRVKIIAWSFVPTTLLFLAVALVTFGAYARVTEDLVFGRDQDLARRSASQLSHRSESTPMPSTRWPGPATSQPPGPFRTPRSRRAATLSMFDAGVVVLDTFGMPVASYPPDEDASFEDWSSLQVSPERVNAFLLRLVRSDRPWVFSDVLGGRTEDDLTVAVGVPILGPGGELLGATVGMFDVGPTSVSALYARIVRLRLSQGGAVYLVDENGRAVYHSDFSLTGSDDPAQIDPASPHLRGGGGLRTISGAGEDVVAAYAPVPGTPWSLVSEVSWSSLTKASRDYQQFLPRCLPRHPRPRRHRRHRYPPSHAPCLRVDSAARAVGAGDHSRRIESPAGDEYLVCWPPRSTR